MFDCAGLLYPALLGLVWRLTAGRARFVLPEFDGVSDCEAFERFEGGALTLVSTWPELMSIIPVGDQANTICLFAIGPHEHAHERLLSILRADQPPRLDTVLATEDDVFAVITQEEEELGLSSVVIAGRGRLRNSFRRAAEQLGDRLDVPCGHSRRTNAGGVERGRRSAR
jgi:hypothetical protein